MAFIDLDDFKKINDAHGHLTGDEVLRAFAGKLQGQLRHSDTVARFGGEEFVALLPNTSETVALDVIRRVLANIVATPMAELEGGPLFVTFSAGVATQGGYERFADVQDLLRAADDVLYRSKNLGRNRVIARSPAPSATTSCQRPRAPSWAEPEAPDDRGERQDFTPQCTKHYGPTPHARRIARDFHAPEVPMSKLAYRRILLKLSGEALMGDEDYGIDPKIINRLAREVIEAQQAGAEVALVIGGGNIFRGAGLAAGGMDRVTGDQMGMLATVINALAMQDALEKLGAKARVMSAIKINDVCEDYIRRRAIRHLERAAW